MRSRSEKEADTVINFGSKPFMQKAGSPGGFELTSDKQSNVWIIVDGKVRYFDENGNIVESGTWHVLWDERTHAVRWVDGRRSNDPAKEEAEQIEEMNKLITTEGLPPRKGHDTPPKNKKP